MKYLLQALRDRASYGRRSHPIEAHLAGAAAWILYAQSATPDDGVAHSFDVKAGCWNASYPETTGYIIPTLYDYARHFGAGEYAQAAYRMALWEASEQLADGGIRAGHMRAEVVVPTVFNTGQVLFGLARAFMETGDEQLRVSLKRAADWLVEAQDTDGAWRRFASPFTTTKINAYNTRTAFGLVRAYEALGDNRYLDAAAGNVEWAVSTAAPNGWLPNNCLMVNAGDTALTHTIAYSIRGITEVAVAVHRSEWIERAARMAHAVSLAQRADGALPGYLDPEWKPAASWSCVTGNSQMAINWLRLAHLTGDETFVRAAERANRFNMSIQDLDTADPCIRGGIKGSHPIDGGYMTWRYPNWAAKFFMDGLMLEILRGKVANVG